MNYAVVDTGSNTIRLSVYSYENGNLKELFTEAVFANLAQHIENGVLTEEGIASCCDALIKHQETAKKYDAEFHTFATAAIRNAENTQEIVEKVKDSTGITLEILSGRDEGELSFLGAKDDFGVNEGIMADIGGGSSEIVAFKDGVPYAIHSVPLGSNAAHKKFVDADIPTPEEVKTIKNEIINHLNKNETIKDIKSQNICLVGGGVFAAAKLSQVFFGNELSVENVNLMLSLFISSPDIMTILEKVVPKRRLTVTPGLAIYSAVCEYFGGKNIYISGKGIKEGYVLKYLIH